MQHARPLGASLHASLRDLCQAIDAREESSVDKGPVLGVHPNINRVSTSHGLTPTNDACHIHLSFPKHDLYSVHQIDDLSDSLCSSTSERNDMSSEMQDLGLQQD